MAEKIWTCKIGGEVGALLNGADYLMRRAISEAFARITGCEPKFLFSGWHGELDESERAVVERRPPNPALDRCENCACREHAQGQGHSCCYDSGYINRLATTQRGASGSFMGRTDRTQRTELMSEKNGMARFKHVDGDYFDRMATITKNEILVDDPKARFGRVPTRHWSGDYLLLGYRVDGRWINCR